jgi:hypothetical protein
MSAKTYRDHLLSLPVFTGPIDCEKLRGRIMHIVHLHENWCPTLKTGKGSDCRCTPEVTCRLEPE